MNNKNASDPLRILTPPTTQIKSFQAVTESQDMDYLNDSAQKSRDKIPTSRRRIYITHSELML